MTDRKKPAKESSGSSGGRVAEDTVRKGYEAAQNPEAQGDGDPGTEPVGERSSPQGDGDG